MSLFAHRPPSSADDEQAGTPTRRPIHFVGSLPAETADSDRAAMQWMLDQAAEVELTTLPCDRDPGWILDWLERLGARRALAPVLHGDSSDYASLPVYRVRRGERLEAADVTPGRAAEVTAAFEARRRLTAAQLPPYQVSMPAPLDLALFAFGVPAATMGRLSPRAAVRAVTSALRHLPLFTKAIVAEIEQVQRLARSAEEEVVIQLESPAVLVAYDRAPRAIWPLLTRILVRQSTNVVTAAPPETGFVFHKWCHGDLGHKPIASLRDLTPMVAFANALATRLRRENRALPPLHVALCDGTTPPSQDPKDYAPLRKLRPEVALIAGVVDEEHPQSSEAALELTEQALGRRVAAVAAACGMGRRSSEKAAANVALARRLAGTVGSAAPPSGEST
jgi:hypothetical protein